MKVIEEINKVDDVLRKVGNVLIVVGLLDVGLMIYCIMNMYGYSSNISIFAIISGFYLRRGSLKAARITSHFSGFYLTLALSVPLLFISMYYMNPSDFDAMGEVTTLEWIEGIGFYMSLTSLYFWVYKTLTQEIVIASMIKYKQITRFYQHPRTGIYLGLFLIVCITFIINNLPPIDDNDEPQQLSSQLYNP